MASPTRPIPDHWLLIAVTALIGGFLVYLVYDAVMSTAAELVRRLIVISPLLLVLAVHWLSSGHGIDLAISGCEPDAIHRAGGSPWGVALVLLLLLFLIAFQPSLLGLVY